MEVAVTTGVIGRKKLHSNHHQQTNTQLFTGWMPFLSPNQQCQSSEGKIVSTCRHCFKNTSKCAKTDYTQDFTKYHTDQ